MKSEITHERAINLMERLQASPKFEALRADYESAQESAESAIITLFECWENRIIGRFIND